MAKKATISDFKSWLGNIGKFSRTSRNIQVVNDEGEGHGNGVWAERYTVHIYTDNNCYGITASDSNDGSYLGCVASSRKPRAGETWTRGNALADGKLTKKTWRAILGDIVSYEMVDLNISSSKGTPDLPMDDDGDCTGPSLGEDGLPGGVEPTSSSG